MKYLLTLTTAGLFSLSAHAADLSQLDYEHYAQSSTWPTQEFLSDYVFDQYDHNGQARLKVYDSSPSRDITSIQKQIEKSPTAAGSHSNDDVLQYDLFGNDIHAQ